MRKFMDKLMRKIKVMPEIQMTCVQFYAKDMSEAEELRDRLCDLGILPKSRENYSIWTGDGKVFTVEEYVPHDDYSEIKRNIWGDVDAEEDEMFAELDDTLLTDFDFGIAPDEWVKI